MAKIATGIIILLTVCYLRGFNSVIACIITVPVTIALLIGMALITERTLRIRGDKK